MTNDDIRALFAPLFPVRLKRMFGGAGIYRDDLIFGIFAFDEVFIKVDAETRAAFEAAGSTPFTYQKKTGETAVMTYWRLPAPAYDEEEPLRHFVGLALAAAARAAALKPPKPAQSPKKRRPGLNA